MATVTMKLGEPEVYKGGAIPPGWYMLPKDEDSILYINGQGQAFYIYVPNMEIEEAEPTTLDDNWVPLNRKFTIEVTP